jgi:hypothetical protein
MIAIEQRAADYEIEHGIGSFRKRAYVWASMAERMPEGQERHELEHRAARAAIHGALERLEMPRT